MSKLQRLEQNHSSTYFHNYEFGMLIIDSPPWLQSDRIVVLDELLIPVFAVSVILSIAFSA